MVNKIALAIAWLVVIPTVTSGVRRFHDLGRSGLHMLWGLIPFVALVLLGWFTLRGTAGPNRFGPDPLA